MSPLELVLDADRLRALVGETMPADVHSTRLRPKHGVSLVAALVAGADEAPVGWIRILTGEARAKAAKTRSVLAEAGVEDELQESELDGGRLAQWGPVRTDPELARELARFDLTDAHVVLRYNPLRRLVLRRGDVVHRITAGRHRRRLQDLTGRLAAAGVPVLEPLTATAPHSRHVTTWPWVPGGDAAASTDPLVHRRAGAALASLHAVHPAALALPERTWTDLLNAAEASVQHLEEYTDLGGPARRLIATLEAWDGSVPGELLRKVVSHGDFSMDQCLLTPQPADVPAGDVTRPRPQPVTSHSSVEKAVFEAAPSQLSEQSLLLADLDRACLAPVALDLATLVATELMAGTDRSDAVLAGYAEAAGLAAAPEVPGDWVAAVLLSRVVEPWRSQTPGWREETERLIRLAAERLGVPLPVSDPKLPGLERVSAQGRLVVHRIGRRAVVKLPNSYAKVLRKGRGEGVARTAHAGYRLATAAGMVAPEVLSCADDVVEFSIVPGDPMHELSGIPAESWSGAWRSWEVAWTRLQALPWRDLPVHDAAAEAAVLRMWAARAAENLAGTAWPERLEETARALEATPPTRLVPTHRDLHDKQLLWDGMRLGLLDLDTLCTADAALDPANLAVHADLRVAQGLWSREEAEEVVGRARAVAAGAEVDQDRWRLYTRSTVARLVAVYATRGRWAGVVRDWAEERWS